MTNMIFMLTVLRWYGFQQFNLFNNPALNNCVVGQIKFLNTTKEEAERIALKYLKVVGMEKFINAKPKQYHRDKSNG